jgi:cytochrome c oxidase cbb3-type subunit 3
MFNHYLQSIEGVGIYPIFSLLVFFIFFMVLIVWMFRADKTHMEKMSELPLDEDENISKSNFTKTKRDMNIKNKFSTKLILLLFVFLTSSLFTTVSAQTTESEGISESYIHLMLILVFGITLMAFALIFYFGMGDRKEPDIHPFAFLKKIWDKLGGAVPVEREDEILLEDDFDGIKELDNKIPPWFNLLFLITVIIAVVYMLNFYVFKTGKLQYQEYQEEMQEAAVQKAELIKSGAFVNENTVTRLKDASSLNAGKNIFKINCVPCHGPEAGGVIGPNLTDDYWIHGGGIKNIFRTITYGVPAKGMISWQTQLNSRQIQEVASYVMSLHGSHPANPKPPQGNKYVEPQDSTTAM